MSPPISAPLRVATDLLSATLVLPCFEHYLQEFMYMYSWVWFPSASVSTECFSVLKCCLLHQYLLLFRLHSIPLGRWTCICLQMTFGWKPAWAAVTVLCVSLCGPKFSFLFFSFISLGWAFNSRAAGSQGPCVFNFHRNCLAFSECITSLPLGPRSRPGVDS